MKLAILELNYQLYSVNMLCINSLFGVKNDCLDGDAVLRDKAPPTGRGGLLRCAGCGNVSFSARRLNVLIARQISSEKL